MLISLAADLERKYTYFRYLLLRVCFVTDIFLFNAVGVSFYAGVEFDVTTSQLTDLLIS